MAHTTTSVSPPLPPSGCREVIRFRYPVWGLQITALLLVVLLAPLFAGLGTALHGAPPLPRNIGDVVIAALAVVATVVVHELVHGLAFQLLGYRVRYGVSVQLMAAYAGVFEQWQPRHHTIIVALAPLLLNLPLLLLMAAPNRLIAMIGLAGLLFNSAGAVGDLYLTYRLWRLPPGSYSYDSDPSAMWLALPERYS